MFIWIDLHTHLETKGDHGDAWAAERFLSHRLELRGVIMSTGEQYHAPEPGWFRLVFCVSEETLREGIRRLVIFLLYVQVFIARLASNDETAEYLPF